MQMRLFHGSERHFPSGFYSPGHAPIRVPFVALNQPPTSWLQHVWDNSSLRVCADGASNRVFGAGRAADTNMQNRRAKPHWIVGDLDSTRPEVLEYYTARGTNTERCADQTTNDMEKALLLVRRLGKHNQGVYLESLIVVDGAMGGRMDHEMGNLNVLARNTDLPLVLVSSRSVVFVLPPGEHKVQRNAEYESPVCGVVALRPTNNVRTNGLKWELDGLDMGFGNVVSSSNEYAQDEVRVTTDVPLLWIVNTKFRA
eukprot:TRINITY_DN4012_c0_g1_i1.p1 TRINITY_DN4012_c0_g1~~TRINITY_DN4012_c0_g1_i1.p1  ORF type:complete len:269 (+),score=34.29 TRINITY_DN4012_c0_g1_i1:40-807(+)